MDTKNAQNPRLRYEGLESIPLTVTVKVGSTSCSLAELGELEPGHVLPLDREIGEPFEMSADGVLLAHVEPVAHGDGIAVKLIDIPEGNDDTRS